MAEEEAAQGALPAAALRDLLLADHFRLAWAIPLTSLLEAEAEAAEWAQAEEAAAITAEAVAQNFQMAAVAVAEAQLSS
jgi:hypothetical protein